MCDIKRISSMYTSDKPAWKMKQMMKYRNKSYTRNRKQIYCFMKTFKVIERNSYQERSKALQKY